MQTPGLVRRVRWQRPHPHAAPPECHALTRSHLCSRSSSCVRARLCSYCERGPHWLICEQRGGQSGAGHKGATSPTAVSPEQVRVSCFARPPPAPRMWPHGGTAACDVPNRPTPTPRTRTRCPLSAPQPTPDSPTPDSPPLSTKISWSRAAHHFARALVHRLNERPGAVLLSCAGTGPGRCVFDRRHVAHRAVHHRRALLCGCTPSRPHV